MRRAVLLALAACGRLIDAKPDPDPPDPPSSAEPIAAPQHADAVEAPPDAGLAATERSSPDAAPGDAAPGDLLASSIADFSGVQSEKGWTYGHTDPNTSPVFSPMTFDGTTWRLPGAPWLALDASGGIPDGPEVGTERWPVRRWTSTVAGTVAITLRLYKMQTTCGDGMDGRLYVDGMERWTRFVGSADAVGVTETVGAAVLVGSTVDLALDPHGDGGCDRAFFSAVIRR